MASKTVATTGSSETPVWLSVWHDTAEAVQASVTVVAIIVGAIWTYLHFVRRREKYPRGNVSHEITHWDCGEHALVHVMVRISNVGETILVLKSILGRIQKLLPFPDSVTAAMQAGTDPVAPGDTEIAWPLVCERKCDWQVCREVEPGETDEFHLDFFVPKHLKAVEVYTYLENAAKRNGMGWNTTSVYWLHRRTD